MIKAIFFDFDGVLTTDDRGTLTKAKNLCKALPGLDFEEVLKCFREDNEDLNLGRKTQKEVWDRICARFTIPADEALMRNVIGTVPINQPMIDLARSLKGKYELGIITDNGAERIQLLREVLNLDEIFTTIIVSASERASKHDGTTKIFDAALRGAHAKAKEAVFIDNREMNLVTAAKMGMKTFWHDDAKNDISALTKALQQWGVSW